MKFLKIIGLSFLFLLLGVSAYSSTKKWLTTKYKVKKIISSSQFIIDYDGVVMPLALTYINISDHEKAKDFITETILDKKITVIPEESAGLTDMGMQRVYVFRTENGKKIFLQQALIEKGFAKFTGGESKSFKKLVSLLKKANNQAQTKGDQNKADKPQGFCSELYSKKYHLLSCKWAKNMNAQSRIVYDSMQSAEKAKKTPCNHCLFERVGELRKIKYEKKKSESSSNESNSKPTEKKKEISTIDKKTNNTLIKGSLFALKGSPYYYSPTSKKIQKANKSDLIVIHTLEDAKKMGKKPDPSSLRIGNPVMPAPRGIECIGRALPYMRPCRRDTTSPTGLCEPCLNAKMR